MELQQAVTLIQNKYIQQKFPTVWADLGCGEGLFTRALATLLIPGSKIFAVDKNISSFNCTGSLEKVVIEKMQADFTQENFHPESLDGIIMANSLHFVKDKQLFIQRKKKYLKNDAVFIIVEYDTDKMNPWVPYPVSFKELKLLFKSCGYNNIDKISEARSVYNRANIYGAVIV